jgi:hypothetical protein
MLQRQKEVNAAGKMLFLYNLTQLTKILESNDQKPNPFLLFDVNNKCLKSISVSSLF